MNDPFGQMTLLTYIARRRDKDPVPFHRDRLYIKPVELTNAESDELITPIVNRTIFDEVARVRQPPDRERKQS